MLAFCQWVIALAPYQTAMVFVLIDAQATFLLAERPDVGLFAIIVAATISILMAL